MCVYEIARVGQKHFETHAQQMRHISHSLSFTLANVATNHAQANQGVIVRCFACCMACRSLSWGFSTGVGCFLPNVHSVPIIANSLQLSYTI
jgi:hypothetical protein